MQDAGLRLLVGNFLDLHFALLGKLGCRLDACLDQIPALMRELERRLERIPQERLRPVHSVFVKIKFNNFQLTTVQCPGNIASTKMLETLMRKGWSRHHRPVRLLGIGVHFEQDAHQENQLELLDEMDNEPKD